MELNHTITVLKAELKSAQDAHEIFNSYHEGFAVIYEELDELWTEIKKSKHMDNVGRVRAEAIHLATMAIRFLIECT